MLKFKNQMRSWMSELTLHIVETTLHERMSLYGVKINFGPRGDYLPIKRASINVYVINRSHLHMKLWSNVQEFCLEESRTYHSWAGNHHFDGLSSLLKYTVRWKMSMLLNSTHPRLPSLCCPTLAQSWGTAATGSQKLSVPCASAENAIGILQHFQYI